MLLKMDTKYKIIRKFDVKIISGFYHLAFSVEYSFCLKAIL